MKYRYWIAALITAGFLNACASADSTESQAEVSTAQITAQDVTEFTTEGKPTKTIETPWGPREIYDINKDETVKEAIESIYARGDVTFGDVYISWARGKDVKAHPHPDAEYIRLSRRSSYFDLIRLGCKQINTAPFQPRNDFIFAEGQFTDNLGAPYLSDIEKSKLIDWPYGSDVIPRGRGLITEKIKFRGRWDFENYNYVPPSKGKVETFDWKTVNPNQPVSDVDSQIIIYGSYPQLDYAPLIVLQGKTYSVDPHFYIGDISGISLAKTQQILRIFECSEWFQPKL